MRADQRPGDPNRQRLSWRCRRGMAELDALLIGFVDRDFDALTEAERAAFERLLTYPDNVLLEWLMGRMVPTEGELARLVERIRNAVDH